MNYSGNGGTQSLGVVGGGPIYQTQGNMPTPTTTRETVSAALDMQQQAVIGLHAIISDLEARLSVALDPPANGPGDASAPAPQPVLVVARVFDHSRGIDVATSRIAELLKRINL